MSSNIYDKPDISEKVRYSREKQEDAAGWQERTVAIYESADDIYDDIIYTQQQERGLKTLNHPAVQKRPLRPATLVFFLLMLTVILILSICFAVTNHELKARITELENINRTLSTEKKQLQEEVKQLNRSFCAYGWTRFGGSCYFKSTEKKRWSESRKDCQDRGADLVIITSPEEQNFLIKLTQKSYHWIGLRTIQTETSGSEWQWVDGSQPKITFWDSRHVNPYDNMCGVCCCSQGTWTWSNNENDKTWICEKSSN
ncbi:CD209 antigen-like protein C [Pholidichthys leucotaenia]